MRFIPVIACVLVAGLAACGEKQIDPAHEPKAPPAVIDTPAAPSVVDPAPSEPAMPAGS